MESNPKTERNTPSLVVQVLTFTLLVTLLDVLLMAAWKGGARPRDVGLMRFVWLLFDWGVDAFAALPPILNHYRDLGSVADVLSTFLIAAAGGLAPAAAGWLLLAPLGWLAGRTASFRPAAARFCTRLVGAAVLVHLGVDWLMRSGWLGPRHADSLAVRVLLFGVGLAVLEAGSRMAAVLGPLRLRPMLAGLCLVALASTGARLALYRLPDPQPGAPNVLLISIDSLRADHLDSYGYSRPTSPHLSRLAAEGARFETVLSPTSWTLPSHVTMLTSVPPQQHGVVNDGMRLAESATGLAEVFSGAGYDTAAFVSGPYLQADYGHAQGFALYDDYSTIRQTALDQWAEVSSPTLSRLVSEKLQAWDAGGRSRPLFIFLHMFDVHFDYLPPPEFDLFTDPDYTGPIDGRDVEYTPFFREGMPAADLEQLVGLYDGEIRFVDEHVGRIIATLNRLGALDDTIIAVTSDHGEEFLDHGGRTHRKTLYDEVLKVPLILRYPPSIRPGTVVERPARTMDIAPTLLSLAAVRPTSGYWVTAEPGPWDPLDLTEAMAGAELPEYVSYGDLHGLLASVRTADSKLIAPVVGKGGPQLYHLDSDPAEAHDVAVESTRLTGLLERLSLWRSRPAVALTRPAEMEAGHLELLRSLGYVR